MPRVFSASNWVFYFWANENNPLEPVHIHISYGEPKPNSTKVWLTRAGGALLASNGANIPAHTLRFLLELVESNRFRILSKWQQFFGELRYYC